MLKNDPKALRVWELAALLALSVSLCVGTWAQGRQSSISSSLVRLHVVAASDTAREQALKLRVRDAVIEYLTPALSNASSAEDARALITEDLEGIEQAAARAAEGRTVTVTLSREPYPTRRYEGFALPAGRYDSLRIILGEGRGRNWWCIVFPPVCLSAVQGEAVEEAMAPADYELITEGDYKLRFRLLELWGELTAGLEQ